MAKQLPLVLILALSACGGTSVGISSPSPKASSSHEDVVALSRTAVQDAAPSESTPVASQDTGERDASVVTLGASMKAQAVPMKDASKPSESPPEQETASSPAPATPMATFQLRRGETLAHFARWSGFPVEDIAKFSDLTLDGDYPVGTTIRLPVSGEQLAEIQDKREEHLKKRVDGYLASRGGSVGNEFYTVHTGDTAWSIAKDDYGVPVWLLEAYNPSTDLDHLRPGEELMVPKLADTVAASSSVSSPKSASQPETASEPVASSPVSETPAPSESVGTAAPSPSVPSTPPTP